MISYSVLMHIRSSDGIILLEFNKEEEQTLKDLPECLDHRPTTFLKGKSWSILSLLCFKKQLLESFMFDALGYKT